MWGGVRLGEAPDGWRTGQHELDGGPYERISGVQASWDGKAWAWTTPSQVRTSMCVVWCSSAHGDVAPRPKCIQFLSDISALMWVCRTHVMTLRNLLFVWQVPIPGRWETAAEPWDRSAQMSSLFTIVHIANLCLQPSCLWRVSTFSPGKTSTLGTYVNFNFVIFLVPNPLAQMYSHVGMGSRRQAIPE